MLPADEHGWEGVARDILESTGADDPPVDAFVVADAWGFRIEAAAVRDAEIDHERHLIKLNVRNRRERQHMSIAHELGHWGLVRAGLPNTEHGARYIGGAIMLERRRFDRDLRQTGWSIRRLREIHANASATAIAVRITQLRDATAAIIDPRGRKAPWHVASPWVHDPRIHRRRVTSWQRELAERAWDAGDEVHDEHSPLCYALPVLDEAGHGEDRVIVVAELAQLSLRL